MRHTFSVKDIVWKHLGFYTPELRSEQKYLSLILRRSDPAYLVIFIESLFTLNS
jgi:hypothetical protein